MRHLVSLLGLIPLMSANIIGAARAVGSAQSATVTVTEVVTEAVNMTITIDPNSKVSTTMSFIGNGSKSVLTAGFSDIVTHSIETDRGGDKMWASFPSYETPTSLPTDTTTDPTADNSWYSLYTVTRTWTRTDGLGSQALSTGTYTVGSWSVPSVMSIFQTDRPKHGANLLKSVEARAEKDCRQLTGTPEPYQVPTAFMTISTTVMMGTSSDSASIHAGEGTSLTSPTSTRPSAPASVGSDSSAIGSSVIGSSVINSGGGSSGEVPGSTLPPSTSTTGSEARVSPSLAPSSSYTESALATGSGTSTGTDALTPTSSASGSPAAPSGTMLSDAPDRAGQDSCVIALLAIGLATAVAGLISIA